ncbi:polysaccharide biosynthesis/export family protein [Hydrogenimonas thermophila]|uniref:polysaccharide biosynthesis/export family protein n=1 Tax=Hydrogenimonas thermophila TaxID=223786 RepID=UPI0029370CBB|nr:polysaccharide biosynthesis/export family protein [Hydrogenimonas thermophila]WOE71511.1 polysaccharide biosynthesis/export family protein [Hydrogenimonas thermophila]
MSRLIRLLTGVALYATISFGQGLPGGLSAEQAAQIVQSNPALLSDPKVQDMIKESKKGNDVKTIVTEKAVENIIDTKESDTLENESKKVKLTKSVVNAFKKPLAMPSLTTLYKELAQKQVKEHIVTLKRYGNDFFINRNKINLSSLPVPNDYELVPEDTLSIILYGPRNDRWNLSIDNEGRIVIPGFGPLTVAGLTFKEAKSLITDTITKAYPNTGVIVNIKSFATIQIVLSGEVSAPGIYNIRSYSTVKDALIAAHGIGKNGSMRDVIVKRNNQIIKHIDFYRLMRYGDKSQELLLKAGDVIVVKPVKKLVSLGGYVKHPAIFEPKKDETLGDIIEFAGGLRSDASRYGIKIKRHEQFKDVKIISIDLDKVNSTKLMDGDKIYVFNLDETNIQKVTLYGNVVKP